MTHEPGPQTKAVRDFLAAKPSAEILAPVKTRIDATLTDYTAAKAEIVAYEEYEAIECGGCAPPVYVRRSADPCAEILKVMEARPQLVAAAEMLPGVGEFLAGRAR